MSNAPTHAALLLATLSLVACEFGGPAPQDPADNPDVAAAHLAAADVTDLTMQLAGIVEVLAPADAARDESEEPPSDSEEPPATACPQVSLSWTEISLDYGAGCVPDNGWTDELVSGSVTLALQGDPVVLALIFDAYTVGDESIDGFASGGLQAATDDQPFTVTLALDLTHEDAAGWTHNAGDLAIGFPGVGVLALGEVSHETSDGASSSVVANDLVWGPPPYAACALPESGSLVVTVGTSTITYTYSPDSPQTGEVEMSLGWWTWTADLCDGGEAA